MTTWLLSLDGPEGFVCALADLIAGDEHIAADAAGAFDLGGGSGWRAEAWFSIRPDLAELTERLVLHLDDPDAAGRLSGLALRAYDDADWQAIGLDGLPPVAAGRFRVFGDHNRPADPARLGRTDLVIQASTAFGTGDHASTQLSLMALDLELRRARPTNVLDLGTGTGILGLALARAVADARVLGSDIEPVAVRMAEANRAGNAVSRRFRALLADGLDDDRFARAAPFDLVLANILPDPLCRLAGPVVRLMAPGARLVVAGLRIGEQARLVAAYRARGLVLVRRLAAKEWASLTFEKPARRHAFLG